MVTVLITGATGGIGVNLVRDFSELGYKVVGTYSHISDKVTMINDRFPNVSLFKVDHDKLDEVRTTYDYIINKYKPNILINNAGIVRDSFIFNMTDDDFNDVIRINLVSSIIVSHIFLDSAKTWSKSKYQIINMSSISGLIGKEGQVNYAFTKGALIGLSHLVEHASSGYENVSSFSIAPGLIDTNIKNKMDNKSISKFKNSILAGRLGKPSEVSKLIISLVSGEISYCNGACFSIDGGVMK